LFLTSMPLPPLFLIGYTVLLGLFLSVGIEVREFTCSKSI